MEKQLASSSCDSTCAGTEADVNLIRDKLVDDRSATDLANLFKALGDPTRVRMIDALLQSELCVHDLAELLGMGQSAISHQLRLLRNMRIVKRRKEGKTVYYSLDDNHVEQIFMLTLQHLSHS